MAFERLAFRLLLPGLLLLTAGLEARAASASVIVNPRIESIHGKETLSQRSLLKVKSSGQAEPFGYYLEAYGEYESQEDRRLERRLEHGAYLQEAYLEFKLDSFFLRAGKQAMRWSEMWVLPSLDIWTGRRWNRLLYDTQSDQFDHSGGVSATYAKESFSVEGFVVSEVARSRFPRPLPEFLDEKDTENLNGGARFKLDVAGLGIALVGGKANHTETGGVGLNYALEQAVLKLEVGQNSTDSAPLTEMVRDQFVTLGADLFFGELSFQPQATVFDFEKDAANARGNPQSLYYLGMTWARDRHDLQAQTFTNTTTNDFFLNVSYGYNLKDWMQIGGFVQNYEGRPGSLFGLYEEMTGGWVGGLRFELNGGFSTD